MRTIFGRPGRTGAFALSLTVLFAAAVPALDRPAPEGAVADHVVVISIDGLRPDAIDEYGATTIQRLMREGSYALDAQTIHPSKTLPSHTSMLTGLPPEEHGITWNSDETDEHGIVGVPTVFEIAKQTGFSTAAFFSKAKFRHLMRPGSLDYSQAPDGWAHWMATRTVGDVVDYLEHERPNLLFVHIGEPDYAGHTLGWMSFLYGMAVRRADAAVERVLEAADDAYGAGNYSVILTADHGGHGRDHGSDDPRDMTIPWIAWGKGVEALGDLRAGEAGGSAVIRTMDTAVTALWLLGIRAPADWTGSPVAAAYSPAARSAALAATGTE